MPGHSARAAGIFLLFFNQLSTRFQGPPMSLIVKHIAFPPVNGHLVIHPFTGMTGRHEELAPNAVGLAPPGRK
jgi:hypothetical protein